MVELVMVMAISGLLAGAIINFIRGPMLAYRQIMLRSDLVGAADQVFRRMERDIHRALPNSLRVSPTGTDGTALELIHVQEGARYRGLPGGAHSGIEDVLTFDGDNSFNILGKFGNAALDPVPGTPITLDTPAVAEWRVAIYTTDSAEIYRDAVDNDGGDPNGIITGNGTTITIRDDGDEDQILLDPNFDFEWDPSLTGRLYVTDTPVTYRCPAGTTMLRDWYYPLTTAQLATGTPRGGQSATITNLLNPSSSLPTTVGCSFTYAPGNSQRSGMVTVLLSLQKSTERIELLQQIRVVNAP